MLLADMAIPFEPVYLMSHQARDVHCLPLRVKHSPRCLADIGIEQCTELAEELQDDVQCIFVRERCGSQMIVEHMPEHGIRGRFLRGGKFLGGHEAGILAVLSHLPVVYYEFNKDNITIAAMDTSSKH